MSAWFFPSLLSRSQLWAELGPNYLYNAYYAGFFSNLATRDFVYYPVVVRLLTLLIHACRIPLSEAGLVLNLTAWLFVNACNAAFCLPYFRRWVRSDLLRFAFTFGLLFYDSYFVRTAINIAYPAFLPICLLLVDLPYVAKLSRTTKIIIWILISLFIPSKPIYIATIPSLAYHSAQAIRRRDWQSLNFAGSLLGVALLSLALLDINGPGGSRRLAAIPLGFTAIEWVGKAILLSLGGRAYIAASTQNLSNALTASNLARWLSAQPPIVFIYVLGTIASSVALVIILRNRNHPLLWRTAAHFLVIATVCTAMVFSSHQFPPPSSTLDFSKRELYAPAALMFTLASMMFAHAIENAPLHSVLFIPWLMSSFPFGISTIPEQPRWPCLERTGWQHIIDRPHLIGTGRSCATMDPIPWTMTGPDCQELWAPPTAEDWQTLRKFRDAQQKTLFSTPKWASLWEVDSVTLMLRASNEDNIRLTLRDADGNMVGESSTLISPKDHVSTFVFDAPVRCARSLELTTDTNMSLGVAMSVATPDQPTWFWFGRLLSTPCERSTLSLR